MLKAIVEALVARPDVTGAAVVSGDGLLIENALTGAPDADALAALAVTLVRHAGELGGAAGLGTGGILITEHTDGTAIIAPAGDGTSHLLVLARPNSDLGALLHDLSRQRPELASQL